MFKDKIRQNLKIALKGKKEIELSVLRMVLAAILNKEKEKKYRLNKEKLGLGQEELEKESQLTEKEITSIIFTEAKKIKEAIIAFEEGILLLSPRGNSAFQKEKIENLIKKEKQELEILKKYLPEPLSEKELYQIVKQVMAETGAKEMKDMGKVMKQVMSKTEGQADGNQVSEIVKELLKND